MNKKERIVYTSIIIIFAMVVCYLVANYFMAFSYNDNEALFYTGITLTSLGSTVFLFNSMINAITNIWKKDDKE